MGLARRAQGARRRRCRCTSLTTSNAAIVVQPPCALWVPAWKGHLLRWRSSRMCTDIACFAPRLASAPSKPGTRPLPILGQAPGPWSEFLAKVSPTGASGSSNRACQSQAGFWGDPARFMDKAPIEVLSTLLDPILFLARVKEEKPRHRAVRSCLERAIACFYPDWFVPRVF